MKTQIKLKSAFEIWNNIPHEDKDNLAFKKEWIAVEDILKYIKTRFVMPFEGRLQGKNIGAIRIHEQITDYNREKFNELTGLIFEQKNKENV